MTNQVDDASSLSGAYALNAMSAAERAQFEAHLKNSEESRTEVTELSDTAVLLGLAVNEVVPPTALKASIMAQLASTPQVPVEGELPSVERSPGSAQAKAQARWFTRPVALLAAAAASVALIVGGGALTNLVTTNSFNAAQASQLAAINAATDSRRSVIALAEGGTATLVWSEDLASSALIVDGLRPLPSNKVYELWYINSAGARPAGTFSVTAGASTWRVLEGEIAAGDTVGVTVEPSGGSAAPTTDPVVVIATA